MGTFEIKVKIKIIQYVCIHKLITLQQQKGVIHYILPEPNAYNEVKRVVYSI